MTCPERFELGMRVRLARYWYPDGIVPDSIPYNHPYRAVGTIVHLSSSDHGVVQVDPEWANSTYFHDGGARVPYGEGYFLHTFQCDLEGPPVPKERRKSGFGKFSKSVEERFGV